MLRAVAIDASPLIRRVASIILRDYGFDVREAAKGSDGIALIARYEPRLVIVDASAPDMSALDILRYIRDQAPKTTHAIYCTAEFDLLDLQRAQAAGATDVLVKPFDRATIATKIDAWTVGVADEVRHSALVRAARAEFMRV